MEWKRLLSSERARPSKAKTGSKDGRSEFQKDYHRIVGSASFRRLQDKTQVFPLERGDFVRTRLTHSLEVSSFAASLGQSVGSRIMERDPSFAAEDREAIIDILRSAGLVHDIGNPPFGHFGETAIRQWFKRNLGKLEYEGRSVSELLCGQRAEDFYHFEGNAQAVRLLSRLHYLVDGNGMNLTYALLNTIVKYPVSSLMIDKNSGDVRTKKAGYYQAEEAIFSAFSSATGAGHCRYPLAFLLEAADDIAYKTGDIEDAVKKGKIGYRRLLEELERARDKCRDEAEREALSAGADALSKKYENAVKYGKPSPEENAVQNWVIGVQGTLLFSATDAFMEHYEEIMAGAFRKELLAVSPQRALCEALGDIAYRYAFRSKEILKLEIAGASIFDGILQRFIPAAIRMDTNAYTELDDKLMSLVSENYKLSYREQSRGCDETQKLYLRLLLVTDYLCGMTDSFAKRLYQELAGIV